MSKNKRVGTEFETRITTNLTDYGFDAYRVAGMGSNDVGDIHMRVGLLKVILQAKAEKAFDLSGYMRAVAEQKARAKGDVGAAVVKRRNMPVGKSYVVMELDELKYLLAFIGRD